MSWLEDVKDFHDKFGMPVKNNVGVPEDGRKYLRWQLIEEESEELHEAIKSDNLVEIADAAADLIYVIIGMCLEYGIPLGEVWAEVHRTNMLKEGGARRKDGKILKPEGWVPPRIKEVLGV